MPDVNYTLIDNCRSCGSSELQSVYAVPPVPVAGIYYKADDKPVNVLAPMTVLLCGSCGLVQLRETISPAIYRDYSFVGNSADSYREHLEKVAESLVAEWGVCNKRVFEIGASNGVMLKLLAENGSNRISGVEPSAKLCENAAANGASVKQGYFNREYLVHNNPGVFDCVVIRHVLEHIDDLNDMMDSIHAILSGDGLLVVEIPDLEAILRENLLSNIFHEHLNYFSSDSIGSLLHRHGLSVIEQRTVNIHGGALLLFCRPCISAAPIQIRSNYSALESFASHAHNYYSAIHEMVHERLSNGKKVHGFGASHRTFVLLGNAGLGCAEVPVIYDSNAFLHGRRLNGFHSLVKPRETIMADAPDAIIVFATSYEEEIAKLLVNECGYRGEIISLRYEAVCGYC